MSFSVRWLDLRAPADSAARDPGLLAAAARFLAGVPDPLAVDLGSGTGATVRAFAPLAPPALTWRLVDADAGLLAEARARGGPAVTTVLADLARETLPIGGARLVTASALFDLVSAEWLVRFAGEVSAAGAGVYAALSYDGHMAFTPEHPLDEAVTGWFNAHQRRDKGFGPALGPAAAGKTAEVLAARGFDVRTAPSPWRVRIIGNGAAGDGGGEADLFARMLLEGIAAAAAEMVPAERAAIAEWLAFRLGRAGTVEVGHADVLALPR